MADSIKGNESFQLDNALSALARDPNRLHRARVRFSNSPPLYLSPQAHNSTRSQSPDAPNEEQERREERKVQLTIEHCASLPYDQLGRQVKEEEERILAAIRARELRVPVGTVYYDLAKKNVRKDWNEQGIWNPKWNDMASGLWKHEEPLELSSESEADSEELPKFNLFSFLDKERPKPKPKQHKSSEDIRQAIERRAIRQREREASRPFHQFIHQVSKERERMEATLTPADINTRAYTHVKSIWIKRGIWDTRWGILPGMSWKHEQPLKEFIDEFLGDDLPSTQVYPPENHNHGGEGASAMFEWHPSAEQNQLSYTTSLWGPSAEQNQPSHTASFQQGNPLSIDPPALENGNAQRTLNSLRATKTRREARSTKGQRPGLGNRNETTQSSSMAEISRGPARLSKVSKPRTKRAALRQGSRVFEPIYGPGTQIVGIQARRRKRLAQRSKIEDISNVVPDPPRNTLWPRRKRAVDAKGEGSAKTQGIP